MPLSSRRTIAGNPPAVPDPHDLRATDESIDRMLRGFRAHGDTYRVFAPARGSWTWVVHHLDDVKRVRVTSPRNDTKGVGIDRVRMLLGNGIMTSEGEFWRRWSRAAESRQSVNLTESMSQLALEVVSQAIFSEDLGRPVTQLTDNPFLLVTRESKHDPRFAFTQMLLESVDPGSGQGISERAQLDVVVAGAAPGCRAPTARGTRWRGRPGAATYDDLERLPYSRSVLQESMRLYPPGWLLTHRSIGPGRLGGYTLPPGTGVFVSPFVVHRHPAFWDNAESSDPDRFGAGRGESRHRFADLPFGAPPAATGDARAAGTRGTHQPAPGTRHLHVSRNTMIQYQTLTEMLDHRSRGAGAIGYLEGQGAEKVLPLAQLRRRALGILHHLQRIGARPGDTLILHVASNEQFIDAYWACLYGGIVPVPVAVGISDEHKQKLLRIAQQLGNTLLYTDRKLRERLATFAATQGEPEAWTALKSRTFLVDQLDDISRAGTPARVTTDQTAFIQFSSGSTSEPKGVVLTHGNILANAEGAMQAAGFGEHDTSLSWMPLTHDMGLIGFHLMMIYAGVRQYLMPTDLFVRRALLWLRFVSEKRVTVTCSPNFGYRHLLRAYESKGLEGVDLSSIRLLFNGAEPISVELASEFLDRMAPHGLRRTAMYTVYGLAEASLAVTFPPPGTEFRYITVDRRSLGVGAIAQPVAVDDPNALKLVCEGKPIPFTSVKLVDDAGAEVSADHVGHLLIKGDNVTRGYFRNPEANAAAISPDGWLRTGDLALWHEGDLYVTGRSKEIIFVNGQNYYPHDLEAVLQHEPGLELGKVAAAGVRSPHSPTDDLVLFVLHRSDMASFLPVATRAMHLVNEHAGVEVARVVPVKRIPKTTSGKLQRTALASGYEDGEFAAELAELDAAMQAAHGQGRAAAGQIERQLKAIVDDTLPGKHVDIDDNLFDVGASSLTLIQIHEKIDELYPGQVDLTELFDFPTVSLLAKHLEQKLSG